MFPFDVLSLINAGGTGVLLPFGVTWFTGSCGATTMDCNIGGSVITIGAAAEVEIS